MANSVDPDEMARQAVSSRSTLFAKALFWFTGLKGLIVLTKQMLKGHLSFNRQNKRVPGFLVSEHISFARMK